MNFQELSAKYRCWRYCRQAQALSKRCGERLSAEQIVGEVLRCKKFPANQKRTEILSLIKLLQSLDAKRVCEIGAAKGGNLCLFAAVAAPDARILSLDLNYPAWRLAAHPRLGRPGQEITCLTGDSHSTETLNRVRQWLGGEQFDFLFIDGDHSLPGVTKDYEMYASLVRKGGLIAFHDIVPDFRTRFGTPTESDTGEVPAFWQALRSKCVGLSEFVEDPNQDGYGIGVVIGRG